MNTSSLGRTIFAGAACLVFAFALIQAQDFSRTAAYFPVAVAIVGLAATAALLASDVWRLSRGRSRQAASSEQDTHPVRPAGTAIQEEPRPSRQAAAVLGWFVWILSYVAALWLFGMEIGTLVFLLASLRWIAKAPWWGYLVAVGVVVLLWYLALIFSLEWPIGKLMGG